MHMLYVYLFMSICDIYTENRTSGKWQFPFVCCKWKTEMANFRLFAANGNGKRKFVSLLANDKMVIDDCCFSKCSHLCSFNQKKNHSVRFSKFYISIHSFGNFIGVKQVWSYLGDID
jgi:hypothetical protein